MAENSDGDDDTTPLLACTADEADCFPDTAQSPTREHIRAFLGSHTQQPHRAPHGRPAGSFAASTPASAAHQRHSRKANSSEQYSRQKDRFDFFSDYTDDSDADAAESETEARSYSGTGRSGAVRAHRAHPQRHRGVDGNGNDGNHSPSGGSPAFATLAGSGQPTSNRGGGGSVSSDGADSTRTHVDMGESLNMSAMSFMPDLDYKLLSLRCEEAAIFIMEGENNIKFDLHPSTRTELQAFVRVHSTVLKLIDLFAALAIMALAMCEWPAVKTPFGVLPPRQQALVEIGCLLVLLIKPYFTARWMGTRRMLSRSRGWIRLGLILAAFIECAVLLLQNDFHFRVTRMFRPFFLIDSPYSTGVRRVLREILQALVPIVDVLMLLMFFMFTFAVLGFYAFAGVSDDPSFATLKDSFVSLFVLVTTANYPDVMMPSYSASPLSFFFFFAYLVVCLYFLQNLLLAVVYDKFRYQELFKFKKLFLHKRQAIRLAYRLLKDDRYGGIPYKNFSGMMRRRKPHIQEINIRLLFLALNKSSSGALNLEEFYSFYDAEKLTWQKTPSELHPTARPYERRRFRRWMNAASRIISTVVKHKRFELVIDLIILANTAVIAYAAVATSAREAHEGHFKHLREVDISFLVIYWLEVALKAYGLGVKQYWLNGWNRFDFLVTLLSTVGIFLEAQVTLFASLRQLRILRLFKVKRRFRQVLGTIISLIPSLLSFVLVLFTVFYSFSVLGIDLYAGKVYKGCCGPMYSGETSSQRYYLNNFDNILRSYVTLFELMVVNNWFIIMDGFVHVTSEWSRIYFMLFYIVAVNVVLNVVIAFVLETFRSRMSFERAFQEELGPDSFKQAEVLMTAGDAFRLTNSKKLEHQMHRIGETQWVRFIGRRPKTMADCQARLFHEEVKAWSEQDQVLKTSMAPVRTMARSRDGIVTTRPRRIMSLYATVDDEERDELAPVILGTVMGDALERMPWALPSQQRRILASVGSLSDVLSSTASAPGGRGSRAEAERRGRSGVDISAEVLWEEEEEEEGEEEEGKEAGNTGQEGREGAENQPGMTSQASGVSVSGREQAATAAGGGGGGGDGERGDGGNTTGTGVADAVAVVLGHAASLSEAQHAALVRALDRQPGIGQRKKGEGKEEGKVGEGKGDGKAEEEKGGGKVEEETEEDEDKEERDRGAGDEDGQQQRHEGEEGEREQQEEEGADERDGDN